MIPLDLAIIFGVGISNDFAYEAWLENNGNVKKSGSWYEIKLGGHNEKVQGLNRVVQWVNENKEEVRDFINANGGYKLLLDDTNAVNIGSSDSEEEMDSVYSNEEALGEFESIGDGEEEE